MKFCEEHSKCYRVPILNSDETIHFECLYPGCNFKGEKINRHEAEGQMTLKEIKQEWGG